jgi:hypothetical protein
MQLQFRDGESAGSGVVTTTTLSAVTPPGPYLISSETLQPGNRCSVSAQETNVAHENVPPVTGIFVIKRTSRVYYKG